MTTRYDPDQHHRRSIRLKGYDYSSPGAYFVTICTRGRECVLDDPVVTGIITDVWHALPGWFPTIILDQFVVMPNHVHLIVWLQGDDATVATVGATLAVALDVHTPDRAEARAGASPAPTDAGAETGNDVVGATLAVAQNADRPWVIPDPETVNLTPTLGNVMGAFQSLVFTVYLDWIQAHDPTRRAKFWQRNYYDHIIRNNANCTPSAFTSAITQPNGRWTGIIQTTFVVFHCRQGWKITWRMFKHCWRAKMGGEGMGVWELPEGWETVRIGDYAVDVTSGFACAKKHAVPEGLPHLRPFNVGTDGELDLSSIIHIPEDFKAGVERYHLEAGDILFNNTNSVELVGKAAIVREPIQGAFSNHITRLRTDRARLLPEWLVLSLRQLWADGFFAARCRKWIGQAGFNAGMLAEVEIPLPPLDEQRRIVTRIEELFALIEEARRLRAAADQDAERLIDAARAEAFQQNADELPKKWRILTISEVCFVNPRRPRLKRKADTPTSFVPMSAVDEASGTIAEVETRPYERVRSGYTYFEEHDVLFAKITPCMQNGKSAIARGLRYGIGFGSTEFHVLRCSDLVLPEWVHQFIRQRTFREEATHHFRGAVGQQRVPQEFLEQHPIPIPPLSEQHRIVEYLDGVQAQVAELKRLQDESVAELDRLSGAVLARAFRGAL